MLPTTAAYLAGVFDGEGWIGKASKGATRPPQFQMQIKMTDERIVAMFFDNFGGTFFKVNRTARWQSHWKDMWVWRASSRQAREAYKTLEPYLQLKKVDPEVLEHTRMSKP